MLRYKKIDTDLGIVQICNCKESCRPWYRACRWDISRPVYTTYDDICAQCGHYTRSVRMTPTRFKDMVKSEKEAKKDYKNDHA